MALRHELVFAITLVAAAMSGSAQAQTPAPAPVPPPGPVYVIAFFEVGAAATKQSAAALREFAAAARKADGNAGVVALQEIGRPARLAIVEAWRDKPAVEAQAAAIAEIGRAPGCTPVT